MVQTDSLFALQDLMHMFGSGCAILNAALDTEKKLKPEFTDYFLKDVQSSSDTSEVISFIPFYFLNHNFPVILMLGSLYSTWTIIVPHTRPAQEILNKKGWL